MEKAFKNSLRSSSVNDPKSFPSSVVAIAAALFLSVLFAPVPGAAKAKPSPPALSENSEKSDKSGARLETYHDLITKAQNLTLQRDRLQTSQVLTRGIQRESKNTAAYKELVKALEELTSVFYTEKAQTIFALAESILEAKPRDALEQYQEALRLEDGNVSILKSLARVQITTGDCEKANATVRAAEGVNPFSPEVRLLRLQVLDCQKSYDTLAAHLAAPETDFEAVEKFVKGLQIQELIRKKETKKAKSLVAIWEAQMPDYPEVHFWKWKLSDAMGVADRASAVKYSQLCQNLTPRRRKSYILDVDLCKGKESADAFLKESGFQPSSPTGGQLGQPE